MKKRKKLLTVLLSIVGGIALLCLVLLLVAINNGYLGSYHVYSKSKDGDIKVACVGDSITYGSTVSNWGKNSYPFVLDDLLGDGYTINNYGYNGTTALKISDLTYTSVSTYEKSLEFLPDIVIIMFGTNDTKSFNWTTDSNFIDDYEALIDDYKSLSSNPKIYIMIPPTIYKEPWNMNKDIVDNNIPIDVLAIALAKGLTVIDLRTILNNHSEYFSKDGVHPNKTGASLIADLVYKTIK